MRRFAPAHLAAFKGVLAGRVGHGHLGEVGAFAQLLVQFLGLALSRLNGLRGGAVGQCNDDVGQAELFRELQLAEVGGEEVLHFLVGDLDALGHPALTHAADDHLAAHLVAGVGIGQAVLHQGGAELLEAHAVALGDAGQRLVEFFIGDANAGAVANLQLDVLDDQALQHLLAEHLLRRQCRAAFGDGLLHLAQACVQLALHDDVVVDNRYDAVERLHLGLRRGTQKQRAQQQRAHAVRKLDLHVYDNLECLDRGKSRPCCLSHRPGP
ncbi:hypothetical protein D3C71_1429420 [compost metagenome]